MLVKAIDKAVLKDASINNIAYALKELNAMERLERGQATQIGMSLNVSADLGDLIGKIVGKVEGNGNVIAPGAIEQNSQVIDITSEHGDDK